MKIGIGSKNKTKTDAVAQAIQGYPMFEGAEILAIDPQVEEFGHPKNIEDTVAGAIERAKKAYAGNDLGFGIEGGLVAVPHTKSGYLETVICAIFDGSQVHIGMGPAFEWPTEVIDGILYKGYDGSQAVREAGLTNEAKLGSNKGTISLLTDGRSDRLEQNSMAVLMALVHLIHPEYY